MPKTFIWAARGSCTKCCRESRKSSGLELDELPSTAHPSGLTDPRGHPYLSHSLILPVTYIIDWLSNRRLWSQKPIAIDMIYLRIARETIPHLRFLVGNV